MAIQTRPLGRTGADVTILGYGAMELRGQPYAPVRPSGRVWIAIRQTLPAGRPGGHPATGQRLSG